MATRISSWDFVGELAMAFDLARTHAGVAIHFRVGLKTDLLFFAGALDAFTNGRGIFLDSGTGDVAVFNGGNFDVKIDAVEERPEMRWR
jgi:hypothetical protein